MSKKLHEIEMEPNQKQIFFGGMMGDSFLSNYNDNSKRMHSNLNVEHSHKQHDYCMWKARTLGLKTFVRSRDDIREGKTYTTVVAYSEASPTYNTYYDEFYGPNGKKKLSVDALNSLEALGLTVWVLDDGCMQYNHRSITLHTERFTMEENLIIQEWFQTKWGIQCSIVERTFRGSTSPKCHLFFDAYNTAKLVEIISPFVPTQDMMYKVAIKPYKHGPRHRNNHSITEGGQGQDE